MTPTRSWERRWNIGYKPRILAHPKAISRAAPSVGAHHCIQGPNTGRNSEGRRIKKLYWRGWIEWLFYEWQVESATRPIKMLYLFLLNELLWSHFIEMNLHSTKIKLVCIHKGTFINDITQIWIFFGPLPFLSCTYATS